MKFYFSFVIDYGVDIVKKMPAGDKVVSPPLSARLQELSSYLKSLQSATPLQTDMPEEPNRATIEPKTPVARINNNWDDEVISSPWTAFNMRSTGAKVVSCAFFCFTCILTYYIC